MTVGMPGSGIGGLFYFCLVAWMPVNEIIQTLRGRSSVARWRHVAFHWSLVASILGALWGQAWLLERGIEAAQKYSLLAGWLGQSTSSRDLFLDVGQVAATGSVLTLAAIVGTAAIMRLVAGRARTPAAPRR